jgi:hypothetical protein
MVEHVVRRRIKRVGVHRQPIEAAVAPAEKAGR